MIYLIKIEDRYFCEVSECGRYALTTNSTNDARIFDDLIEANHETINRK